VAGSSCRGYRVYAARSGPCHGESGSVPLAHTQRRRTTPKLILTTDAYDHDANRVVRFPSPSLIGKVAEYNGVSVVSVRLACLSSCHCPETELSRSQITRDRRH
jgi:hypothetical protein